MRQHKFRGKKVDTGEWVYGYHFVETKYSKHFILPGYFVEIDDGSGNEIPEMFEVIPETVGQYIETINGHEIYHHDIVKAYKYGDTETSPFIYDITYRNGTWWFGNWTWIEFLQIFRCVEVIGNIHDNPELMEVHHEI